MIVYDGKVCDCDVELMIVAKCYSRGGYLWVIKIVWEESFGVGDGGFVSLFML